jgi:hypothetical protein
MFCHVINHCNNKTAQQFIVIFVFVDKENKDKFK